jgi:hypothetical protein
LTSLKQVAHPRERLPGFGGIAHLALQHNVERQFARQRLGEIEPVHADDLLRPAEGLEAIRREEKNIIDRRLYDWGQQVQSFRNLAAHGEDFTASRQDAEDLQAFVHAITEYVYDLTDRYNEFREREEEKKKPRKSVAEMFAGVATLKTN